MYKEELKDRRPVIMGHENIGIIVKAGKEFTRARASGRRSRFVEHYVACGKCEWCIKGDIAIGETPDWRSNPDGIRYGYSTADKPPHLWGGFANTCICHGMQSCTKCRTA